MDADASSCEDLADAEGLVLDGDFIPGAVAGKDQVVGGWTADEGHVDCRGWVDGLAGEERRGVGSGGQEDGESGLVAKGEHLDGLVVVTSSSFEGDC